MNLNFVAQVLVGYPEKRLLFPYFLQLFLLAVLALMLCNCASRHPYDPQRSYYLSYCHFPTDGVDAATANYWKLLCKTGGGNSK